MIGIFYGTRPEYIKLLPLIDELDHRAHPFKLIQVGQHDSLIEGCDYDYKINIKGFTENRLNDIIVSVLETPLPEDISSVVVQGDTTAGMAVALTAFNKGIKVIHLEAGLRTHDARNPFPEEINRRIISSLADEHYCPRIGDAANLHKEGWWKDKIVVTGNTCIDNLVGIPTSTSDEILVTLHRRENHDQMREWCEAIEKLATEFTQYKFIFPMHPNPNVQKHKGCFSNVKVCDPIPFDEMKHRIANCKAVITDSGGIQEECSFFKKICFVCREVTERACASSVMCLNPNNLINKFSSHIETIITEECPFGSGDSAKKIADEILRR
tara:strand:- start:1955 stop:2932 length:978 start_codon:yes stop_codon:yes gene_type:complete